MAVDLSKIAASAIEAALDDGQSKPMHKKRAGAVTAVAAGAALAVAAKAATSKHPLLTKLVPTPSLDGLRDIPDRVRDRFADNGSLDDDEDGGTEDEGPVDEVEQEEPVEEEEDFDEDEEEPVDEEEEGFDED